MAHISLATSLATVRVLVDRGANDQTPWNYVLIVPKSCTYTRACQIGKYVSLSFTGRDIKVVFNQADALSALSRSYRNTLCKSTSAPIAQSSGLVYSSGL